MRAHCARLDRVCVNLPAAISGEEPEIAQYPQEIFSDPLIGIANKPQSARLQIAEPFKIVENFPAFGGCI